MGISDDELDRLEQVAKSPRDIAFLRKEYLESTGNGLSSLLLGILCESLHAFESAPEQQWCKVSIGANDTIVSSALPSSLAAKLLETDGFRALRRSLSLILALCTLDPTLGEELKAEGCPQQLSKLVQYDASLLRHEEDQDVMIELQDSACEIMSRGNDQQNNLPFTAMELHQRLPLVVSIDFGVHCGRCQSESSAILIHQVTARQRAQEDVGFGTYSRHRLSVSTCYSFRRIALTDSNFV